MWPKKYKDYPTDKSLIKNKVEPGKGIVGCEMHEINGWGTTDHQPPLPDNKGWIATLVSWWKKEET